MSNLIYKEHSGFIAMIIIDNDNFRKFKVTYNNKDITNLIINFIDKKIEVGIMYGILNENESNLYLSSSIKNEELNDYLNDCIDKIIEKEYEIAIITGNLEYYNKIQNNIIIDDINKLILEELKIISEPIKNIKIEKEISIIIDKINNKINNTKYSVKYKKLIEGIISDSKNNTIILSSLKFIYLSIDYEDL